MQRIPRFPAHACRRFSAGALLAALLWVLALAASPQLHELIHADSGGVNHECAVTLIQSGGVDDAPPAIVLIAWLPVCDFVFPKCDAQGARSFLTRAVLEHAPPA